MNQSFVSGRMPAFSKGKEVHIHAIHFEEKCQICQTINFSDTRAFEDGSELQAALGSYGDK